MSNDQEMLIELRERLSQMEEEVGSLRDELEAARGRVNLSMRGQLRCPSCGGASLLHVEQLRCHSSTQYFLPMAIQLDGMIKVREIGPFEAFVCRECGLTEWYVKGASEIDPDELDKKNRQHVHLIEGEPKGGESPYR